MFGASRANVETLCPVSADQALADAFDQFCSLSNKGEVTGIHFSAGEATLTTRDGCVFRFDVHDRVARMYSVPLTGLFEAKETAFVRGLIRPGQTCFDVGASFGWYTLMLSRLVGREGWVHAFEPVPHTYAVLTQNIRLNACPNVTAVQSALADSEGMGELFLPDIGVSGSFRLHDYEASYERIPCRLETLDEYCVRHGVMALDFLKADVEGAEWQVLRGGAAMIERCRPVLFLEIQQHSTELFGYQPNEMFQWLRERKYVPYRVTEEGVLATVDCDNTLPDYNFIFLPQERTHEFGEVRA